MNVLNIEIDDRTTLRPPNLKHFASPPEGIVLHYPIAIDFDAMVQLTFPIVPWTGNVIHEFGASYRRLLLKNASIPCVQRIDLIFHNIDVYMI